MAGKNLTKKHISSKIIAIVITALVSILAVIGIYVLNKNNSNLAQASQENSKSMEYEAVEEGDENIDQTNNVKFDAYFLKDLDGDGTAEKIRGTNNSIGEEDTLYMDLNVQMEGYLKDAKITINSQNFYLKTDLQKDEIISKDHTENNTKEIKLNAFLSNINKTITGLVRSGDYSNTSTRSQALGENNENYSEINSVTLTGTYVDESGTETEINKVVEFNVDWLVLGKDRTVTYPRTTLFATNATNGGISTLATGDVTYVDLTGLVTGDDVSHTHIYESKYDDTNHWEECFICGNIRNQRAHSLQENWTMGDSCSPDNVLIHSCSCGYSYTTENTRSHSSTFYEWNNEFHQLACSKCRTPMGPEEKHKDSSGATITCTHGGTCVTCGRPVGGKHSNTLRFRTSGEKTVDTCASCGINYINSSSSSCSITYDSNNNFTATAKVVIGSNISIKSIEVLMSETFFYSRANITSKNYSVSGNTITYTLKGRFNDGIEMEDSWSSTANITGTNGQVYELISWIHVLPDTKAPSITSAQVIGNGTVGNYSRQATIKVNLTENWCSTVYMSLYTTSGECLVDWKAGSSLGNKQLTAEVDIVGEYRTPQTLVVKVKDNIGNETS